MTFPKISLLATLLGALNVNGYILQGISNIGYISQDPIVDTGMMFGNHTHMVGGSSNFGPTVTSDQLRAGSCTSVPISQDHSNYWVPSAWFQWKNGSYSSLSGGFVIYYLFDSDTNTTAFPDNFRMISGTHTLRTYDPSSFAQRAVTMMCLDFNGVSKTYNHIPTNTICPSGIRAQINFPSCWDGKNLDSSDHKSHVAFPSGGPDSGTCSDPNFPIRIPRIFIETYWDTSPFNDVFDQALCPEQPIVLSNGDRTGYGWHGDFYNGWEKGVLQNVIEKCDCTIAGFGDPTCCGNLGVVDFRTNVPACSLANPSTVQVTGLLDQLPRGNIPTGLIAVNNGEIYANGTWDLAMPLSQQPAPVVLPGTGNAVVASAASATSSVKATSSAISSSAKVISTASAVKTSIASIAPSSSIVHASVAPSSVPASKSAASSVSATNSVAKASPTPIGSGSSLGGNGNGDTWTLGVSSAGSSQSASSAAASSTSASSSSGKTSSGSQSSSNNAGSNSNSNSNSGSAANNNEQAPAQNSAQASSSWGSSAAAATQTNAATSGSSSNAGSVNTSSGSSSSSGSSGSGNDGASSSSSSSQNTNSGVVNASSGSSSSNSDGTETSSSGTSSSSSSGSGSNNGGSSSSSSESSNSGSSSGSSGSGNNVPAPAQSQPASGSSGSAVASNQPVGSAPASAAGSASTSTNSGSGSGSVSGNSSSGTSNNAAKCKNRHASSLEARAAEAAPIKHAAISSHHARARAFNRMRNANDMLI